MHSPSRNRQDIFSLAGWLFADLLLVLSIVFLVAAQPWRPMPTKASTAATPTPKPLAICGVAKYPQTIYVRSADPSGLLAANGVGIRSFQSTLLHSALQKNRTRVAGLVEVFGGGTVDNGTQLATSAIQAMRGLTHSGFVFASGTAYFRPLWNGRLPSDTLEVDVFYLVQAQTCAGG